MRDQVEFQEMVGFPSDSILESVRNELSEKFIFKLIEEAVELRKEFPSVVNPWSKSQKTADLTRVKEELSDVILFLVNIINVWKFTPEELAETIQSVQRNNFRRVKEKKMNLLNSDILKIPGRVSGIGQGSLTPKYIFIGQNPGKGIVQGYKFWSDPKDGSSRYLLRTLEKLGILKDCYFTNVVKCTTPDNGEPTNEMRSFYNDFLFEELNILSYDNPGAKVIVMGKWAGGDFGGDVKKISHPAVVGYGSKTQEQFDQEVIEAIK